MSNRKKSLFAHVIKSKNKKENIFFKLPFYKNYIFFILIFSKLNNINCNDNDSKNNTKTLVILILLVVASIVIITLIVVFVICICCKRRQNNRNNYIEGSNVLERGSPEEVDLRERITNEGVKVLSNFLKEKLITDIYNKKFEIFGTQCSICLDNFVQNNSVIIIGGCFHIFHQKCISELAEKVDLNKNILSQFICPTCRNNLTDGIDNIKKCIDIYPNFFDDMYKNKRITKIKHVKNIIEKIINETKDKDNTIKDGSSREKLNKNNDYFPKIKNDNNNNNDDNDNDKDISYGDISIPIKKLKKEKHDSNIIKEKENININDIK